MCCTATNLLHRHAHWSKSLRKCDATDWNDSFVFKKRFKKKGRQWWMSQKSKVSEVEEKRRKLERKFGNFFIKKGKDKNSKRGSPSGGGQRVNIPNMPILHGRLPGDRGGFRWWWCVRTKSRRLGALQDTPRVEALKRPEQSEPVWGARVGGEVCGMQEWRERRCEGY